ncbi:STE/STE7/MEK1 protein kinase [Mycena venus]|uniref:STE/STE7/MEK1 protein kinase n=1 Tax=Mycena venus TaxID=2733690 RepID=A0A8H6XPA2_9AGAR|nr:STE/STE7/MEK1 protein kinase [Mycena venus]
MRPRKGMTRDPLSSSFTMSSIRKKRNFRDLQLPAGALGPKVDGEPMPTRVAPLGPRQRPPPLRENGSLLGGAHHASDMLSSPESSLQASLSSTIASLDPKPQYKEFDLKNDDFTKLDELGQGNGGSVMKVQHVPTGTIMAKKVVLIDAKPAERKKILLELQIMHDCDSPYIISSYGAYLAEPNICICMEFMDKGSFDGIYKRIGAIDIKVVGKVAVAVLEGLRYLYDIHRIIHRDIKPSNILCNSNGDIKLCDFGVSGELINSIANTFVGTSIYMSPERIQGATYSVKSDIWSLGITLIELSVGQFPFSGSFDDDDDDDSDLPHVPEHEESPPPQNHRDSLQVPLSAATKRRNRRRSKGVSLHGGPMMMSIIELMHQIVNEPSPRLPTGKFGAEAEAFVDGCLEKDVDKRRTPGQLFDYAWILSSRQNGVDMKAWAATF